MCKILTLGIMLAILVGCVATSPKPTVQQWHPKFEAEFRQIVGETVVRALDWYQQYMAELEKRKAKPPIHDPKKERVY